MQKGNEIGIAPYKYQSKASSDNLTKLIYEVNDVMYKYAQRPISHKAQKRILNIIKDLGTRAKALDVPDTAAAKKNELLTKLRTSYTQLLNYDYDDNTYEDNQKLIGFSVAMMLKEKKADTPYTPQQLLQKLLDIREIYEDYIEDVPTDMLNTRALEKFHREYQDRLSSYFVLGNAD